MRKLRIFGIVLAMIIMSLCLPVSAQSTVITQIDFSNANAVAEENLSLNGYGDKDSGYATATEGGRIYASVSGTDLRKLEWSKGEYGNEGLQPVMTGGTKNPWGSGAYWEVRVSTEGYENVSFSAQLGATNKGPRDYKLQYSTDGVVFRDVAGAVFSVTANKMLYAAFDNVSLPAETANCTMLYIRVAVASNMLVNGTAGLIGSTGGEMAVNHVKVCATPIATTTQTASTTKSTDSDTEQVTTTTVNGTSATTASNDTVVTTSNDVSTTTTVKAQTSNTVSSVNTGDETQVGTVLGVLILMGCVVIVSVTMRKRIQ